MHQPFWHNPTIPSQSHPPFLSGSDIFTHITTKWQVYEQVFSSAPFHSFLVRVRSSPVKQRQLTRVYISLGLLFTHWIADSLTLWKSPETQTDVRLWTSATYYSILSHMPPMLLYLYGGVVFVGATTLLWSLGDGEAGNLMFDGGSACKSSFFQQLSR